MGLSIGLVVAALLTPVLPGCAARVTGASDRGSFRVLAARLEECGLLSDGEIGPASVSGFYAPSACYQDCLANADCEALSAAYCRTDLDLLFRCDERCAFRCADGSLLGVERVCNGRPECPGGDDEAGCEITCANGVVTRGALCDGTIDCRDSSDERECVPRCADGRYVLTTQRCDGRNRCPDGSDEAGCFELTCDVGTPMRYVGDQDTPRCNGTSDCRDGGSDEIGCARVSISCGP